MKSPFFSVCIPQYDRTDFLLKALESLLTQKFRDFEICISDDQSPDGRQQEVFSALRNSGRAYRFHEQEKNRRYDANLRTAIGLARGEYCFLLGNDDALVDEHALNRFHDIVNLHSPCGVVISDYQDYRTGAKANRVRSTGKRGAGPEVAARYFRNLSFVSGVVLERRSAQAFATGRWDGSEMYQTFIGCGIIASGKALVELAEPLIRKDIYLPDLRVDSYANQPRIDPCPIVERSIPLVKLGRLTVDAIAPYLSKQAARRQNSIVLNQLVLFTYPFWLFEYRRVQSWPYAVGIAIGMRPRRIAEGVPLTALARFRLKLSYVAATLVGLSAPQRLFKTLVPLLYRWAKLKSS